MIDERLQEQAALHVLGALTEAEAREFKAAMRADPELKEFVASLTNASGALAGTVPSIQPPPHLRARVLSQVAGRENVLAREETTARAWWLPWALAACGAILCAILVQQDFQLRQTAAIQGQKIEGLNQLAQSLQSTTNDLQKTIIALQETNRLANLKIAMLNSLVPGEPKAAAVSLWDSEKQHGIFVAEHLRALPADKDYELWVIDENQTPVASGVFHVEKNGTIRIDFKPGRVVAVAAKFAVTEEVKGGVASPTVTNMILASD